MIERTTIDYLIQRYKMLKQHQALMVVKMPTGHWKVDIIIWYGGAGTGEMTAPKLDRMALALSNYPWDSFGAIFYEKILTRIGADGKVVMDNGIIQFDRYGKVTRIPLLKAREMHHSEDWKRFLQ